MEVGQTIYIKKVGNAARHTNEGKLIAEAQITKIGNKYFYLKSDEVYFNKCKFS